MAQPRHGGAAALLAILLLLGGLTGQGRAQGQDAGKSKGGNQEQDHEHEDPREALKELMQKDQGPPPDLPHGVHALTQELRTAGSDRRKLAAGRSLAGMGAEGNAEAMAALIGVLNDDSAGQSRIFAAIALRDSRSSEAVAPLVQVLENTALPPDLRKQAALSLGHLGDPRGLQPLLRATDDPTSVDVRYYASVALGQGPLTRFTAQPTLLVKIVKDRQQPQFRRARAASHLGPIGDSTIVEPLIEILLTEPRSPEIALSDAQEPSALMFARIMNKQRNIRAKIAVTLGVHGDGRAVVPLLKVMTTAQDDPQFMKSSQNALAKVAKRVGMAPFVVAVQSPHVEVRRQALTVLAEMEGVDKNAVLKEALKDNDPEIRAAAGAILAKDQGSTGGVNAPVSDKK